LRKAAEDRISSNDTTNLGVQKGSCHERKEKAGGGGGKRGGLRRKFIFGRGREPLMVRDSWGRQRAVFFY